VRPYDVRRCTASLRGPLGFLGGFGGFEGGMGGV